MALRHTRHRVCPVYFYLKTWPNSASCLAIGLAYPRTALKHRARLSTAAEVRAVFPRSVDTITSLVGGRNPERIFDDRRARLVFKTGGALLRYRCRGRGRVRGGGRPGPGFSFYREHMAAGWMRTPAAGRPAPGVEIRSPRRPQCAAASGRRSRLAAAARSVNARTGAGHAGRAHNPCRSVRRARRRRPA